MHTPRLFAAFVSFASLAPTAACSSTAADGPVGVEGDDVTAGAVSFRSGPSYVDVKNGSGTFRIYTECKGPDPSKPDSYIGHDGAVGPGYVATAWDRLGRVVLDDTKVPAHVGPNSGATGIGQFGFHLARVPQNATTPFTAGTFRDERVFQIAGRFCNANRRPTDYGGYNGFGVRSAKVLAAPRVDGDGVGHFAIESVLGDAHSDLVRVHYTYQVGKHDVGVWIRVTVLCSLGKCESAAANGDAFVKEPKITVGVNPDSPDELGFHLMDVFADGGRVAASPLHDNHWKNACDSSPGDGGPNLRCEYGGENPVGKTGQCDDAARAKMRFWNGADCASDPACLVVAARGADKELAPGVPWSGAPRGLDAWAVANVAEHRDRAAEADSPDGGAQTACYLASDNPHNRRWELAGFAKTARCAYTTAVGTFHAWEGGTGIFDCENLYYRFGQSTPDSPESYVVALSFGFNSAKAP